jgi:hypothetical protein
MSKKKRIDRKHNPNIKLDDMTNERATVRTATEDKDANFLSSSKDIDGFIKLPILRGFTEIVPLYEAVTKINCLIAGGYARYCASPGRSVIKASDIDLFPQDKEAYEKLYTLLVIKMQFGIKHENGVSITLAHTPFTELAGNNDPRWGTMPTIQIIKPVEEGHIVSVGDIETILNNFDFSIVRAAIISPTECLVDANFEEDEYYNFLRIKNIHCPISSSLRFMKYTRKGYFTRPLEVLKLFMEWDVRGNDYKNRMIELFKTSNIRDEEGNIVPMTQENIDELEALLRID